MSWNAFSNSGHISLCIHWHFGALGQPRNCLRGRRTCSLRQKFLQEHSILQGPAYERICDSSSHVLSYNWWILIKFCTLTDTLMTTLIIHEARMQTQGLSTCFLPFGCIIFLNKNYRMTGMFFSPTDIIWILVVFILNSWVWKGMIPSAESQSKVLCITSVLWGYHTRTRWCSSRKKDEVA